MLPASAFAAEESAATSPARIASRSGGSSVTLRPLDDPDNPWAAEYGQRERWLYERYNAEMDFASFMAWQQDEREAGESADPRLRHISVLVDAQGFVIPLGRYDELYAAPLPATMLELYQQYQRDSTGSAAEDVYHFIASSVMTEKELADFRFEDTVRRSAKLPPIPAWLGEEPPLWVAVGPDGEWLAQGKLGMTPAQPDDKHGYMLSFTLSPLAGWYRYDSAGRLLGSTEPQGVLHDWQQLYWPELAELRGKWRAEQIHVQERGGYIFLKRSDDFDMLWPSDAPETLVAIHNYRGEQLDPQSAPDPQLLELGNITNTKNLQELYLAQLQSGRSSADSPSPHEGQALGPQRHVGEKLGPQTQLLYGAGSDPFSFEAVILRPADDPENPYRGEYSEWDHWLHARIGLQDPAVSGAGRLFGDDVHKQVYAAQQAGQTRSEFMAVNKDNPRLKEYLNGYVSQLNSGELPPRTPDWRMVQGAADENGFPLPLTRFWQQQLLNREQHFVRSADKAQTAGNQNGRHFELYAGGVLDSAQYERLQQAQLAAEAALLPAIPQWLTGLSSHVVYAGPAGEWISWGLPAENAGLPGAVETNADGTVKTMELRRYSADGELLASIESGKPPFWPLLYEHDAVQAIFDRHADREDVHVMSWYGFIIVYSSVTEKGIDAAGHKYSRTVSTELLELYDWRGTALPLDSAIRPEGWIGHPFSSRELPELYQAQQALGR